MGAEQQQQLRVVASYSDGRKVDVTRLAQFLSNLESIAQVTEEGLVTAGRLPGQAAVMARFMGQVARLWGDRIVAFLRWSEPVHVFSARL
jgi:hypothetical protein